MSRVPVIRSDGKGSTIIVAQGTVKQVRAVIFPKPTMTYKLTGSLRWHGQWEWDGFEWTSRPPEPPFARIYDKCPFGKVGDILPVMEELILDEPIEGMDSSYYQTLNGRFRYGPHALPHSFSVADVRISEILVESADEITIGDIIDEGWYTPGVDPDNEYIKTFNKRWPYARNALCWVIRLEEA